MGETLGLYFSAFKHFPNERDERKISYIEMLTVSWSLHLIEAIYSVVAIYLGLLSYDYLSDSKNFTQVNFDFWGTTFQKWSILTSLFSVVFYPFIFQFAWKFWRGCFKFFATNFNNIDDTFEEKCEDILRTAFSSNLLLILPIAGNILSKMAMPYFIFTGLKRKLGFTSMQASLVLLTPAFILFLFAIFSATYFVFLITLI